MKKAPQKSLTYP